jgi:hypothetical protein
MMRWEYRKIDLNDVPSKISDIDILVDAGRDGWELVGVSANNVAYLKRQLDDPAATPTVRRRSANSRA